MTSPFYVGQRVYRYAPDCGDDGEAGSVVLVHENGDVSVAWDSPSDAGCFLNTRERPYGIRGASGDPMRERFNWRGAQ